MKILFLLMFISCTTYRKVATTELQLKRLPGQWISDWESELLIHCNGTMSYKIVTNLLFFKWHNYGAISTISKISEDELSVEPFRQTWKVSQWPSDVRDRVEMIVDGRTWTLNSETICQ